jgi:uncharacterized paraquat-inducible protein A
MNKNFLKQAIEESRIRSLQSSRKQFPSVGRMVANLGAEVVNNIKSVASGQAFKTDDEEANKRKSICNSCEFFNKSQERCTKCGCFMAVKVYLKASHCPIGKW